MNHQAQDCDIIKLVGENDTLAISLAKSYEHKGRQDILTTCLDYGIKGRKLNLFFRKKCNHSFEVFEIQIENLKNKNFNLEDLDNL